MNEKLFEAILKEGIDNGVPGYTKVETEEELRGYLEERTTVRAMSTGPFGEDEGAEVIAFGRIGNPRIARKLEVDEGELEEFGCSSVKEYIEEFADETDGGALVIVLDTRIGQGGNNFYMLDGRDVADCDLYVSDDDL